MVTLEILAILDYGTIVFNHAFAEVNENDLSLRW